ncbi:VCBS repeat-containing protein [Pareuzebyella sediminis]|uniref:VCBS repeat-containing protein n=1 Tax=Pareuzebyella sediminis TaxID=2607998 RepID=UPI0011EFD8AE|nr:VCBS repeat-containing protein [Pareuzebyella sediminis]
MRLTRILVFLLLVSCAKHSTDSATPLFSLKDSSVTGITFENTLVYTENFNPYLYRNFYNGGGVAIGDINNDGLEDIYFTGNMVDNKLYLNQGNWTFKDITKQAGVGCPNVWSTGATFVDINGDGLLDIYVCKSGKPGGANRHNELFINNGDLTFNESSKAYGLDVEGLSVHAAFFDYDKDGDLDAYVLNNSLKSIGGFDLVRDQRNIPDEQGNGNKFFRNDHGNFKDITKEAGIYSSKIGFGLGITLGDFNSDNWTDIFISNDFFERDYLYINNRQGGFSEELESYFGSISMGSMGADMADLNNDMLPDLMVTEMLPQSDERKKTKTVFESWDKHDLAVKQGYYYQYPRNTLQRNFGNRSFSEIGRQANVSATEWSWAALLFDMDNDGLRDIFISNGIFKDLLDRDYLNFEANQEAVQAKINSNKKNVITKLIDAMPSKPVPNVAYRNLGRFRFENSSAAWGLETPSFSNGSAYADLDNDGDLDLVLNNVNMASMVYENHTDTLNHRSIQIKFDQEKGNTKGIAAKAIIKYGDGKSSYAENFVSRGFQSSVPPTIHFGVGETKKIDSLIIEWPDGNTQIMKDLSTNRQYIVHPNKNVASSEYRGTQNEEILLEKVSSHFTFLHKENKYIDFNNERLLPQMYSNEGPAFATADVNNDGLPDYFIGGAKAQSGQLYLSSPKGYLQQLGPFEEEKNSEDTHAEFFDGDNDGDLDLYVCHGGKAYSAYSTDLNDAYYINNGASFVKASTALSFSSPISTSVVKPADYDRDGDIDLFIGERYKANTYGLPGSGYLLQNNGRGEFTVIQTLKDIGMITDARWLDLNQDGQKDLILAGEWMPLKAFIQTNGKFVDESDSFGFQDTNGMWTALELVDADDDGDLDIVAGNVGRNNFYEPDMRMFISDFDKNGFQEQLITKERNGNYYPIVDKDELISQIPELRKKLLYYKDYAKANMASIFPKEALNQAFTCDIKILESTIFVNENGRFTARALPEEIQYAPIYSITVEDIDGDGLTDVFFGGNQFLVKPQFGRYDASLGWGIFGPLIQKNTAINQKVFPLHIKGQIRSLSWSSIAGEKTLIAIINNDSTVFYKKRGNL